MFLITVRIVCPCGWLMHQWGVDFLCGNPRCEHNGKHFRLDAVLGEFKLSERMQ